MSLLEGLSPKELVIIAALIAILIIDDLSADDLNVLGNFVVAVGGLLLTAAAQKSSQESAAENPPAKEGTKKATEKTTDKTADRATNKPKTGTEIKRPCRPSNSGTYQPV
ncbi:hypothetical protein [Heliophilum fasciatum]|uniref:Uncharacterized protein n=1 Tax=Heliophilum fasciatum TaxID=35700 RepID=A0A4R2RL08_9FIRM|nr:hypothetical protein [Heliophilum fasciatum]MCW2278483.1 hypothetical protein [Heliophilum fasciatum]TCP63614.1 hypothetical protein EDD73_11739 [Heliophilum fasciatum]